jgi:hypothetical protein
MFTGVVQACALPLTGSWKKKGHAEQICRSTQQTSAKWAEEQWMEVELRALGPGPGILVYIDIYAIH